MTGSATSRRLDRLVPGPPSRAGSGSWYTSAVPSSTSAPSWLVIVVRIAEMGLSGLIVNLGFGRDLVARSNRCSEAPIDVPEHAAGAGQILGHQRVEESGGHAALHDDPPKRLWAAAPSS